jgi:hypothetical protein
MSPSKLLIGVTILNILYVSKVGVHFLFMVYKLEGHDQQTNLFRTWMKIVNEIIE